jgi:ribonuclease G
MTAKKLIISSDPYEMRVALLENGKPAEIFSEVKSKKNILTNIYKGTVTRVLPGMNSSFVDLGVDKAGFLFGGDVIDTNSPQPSREELEKNPDALKNTDPIEKVLSEGQEIICQVVKEPLGSKGPRISMGPKIPGRYLVLMPDSKHIGISRRIEDEAERSRLTSMVEKYVNPDEYGVIIRTAAVEATDAQLEIDLKYLVNTWKEVRSKVSTTPSPGLLFEDINLAPKLVRDLYSAEIIEIICDQKEDYDAVNDFLEKSIPEAKQKIRLYEEVTPLFEVFNVDKVITQALSKKTDLPSGGSLIIEQTEALTTIDINTGRYTGKQNQRETILKTNVEAIPSIVEQLRLRNIGGIIIIDFIDMDEISDREVIFNEMNEAFKADRARTNILRMSDLGLVQMTRKRTNESIQRKLTVPCKVCSGTGRVKRTANEGLELIRQISKTSQHTKRKNFTVSIREDILSQIQNDLKEVFKVFLSNENIQVDFNAFTSAKIINTPDENRTVYTWDISYSD